MMVRIRVTVNYVLKLIFDIWYGRRVTPSLLLHLWLFSNHIITKGEQMTEVIVACIPAIIVIICGIFKTITNLSNNKTRLKMYKLAIEAGHKHGMIDNNCTTF